MTVLRSQSAAQALRVNRGRKVENRVEEIHESYAFAQHARLYRAHPGVRAGRIVSPQGPDFSGFLVASGRHVFVEVKGILSGGLSLPRPGFTPSGEPRTGAFTPEEIVRLRACHEAGGLAVVLVVHGPLAAASWCPVPWALVESALEADTPSLTEARLLARRCDPPEYLLAAEYASRNLWRSA